MQKRMIEISFSKVTSVHLINLSGQQKSLQRPTFVFLFTYFPIQSFLTDVTLLTLLMSEQHIDHKLFSCSMI